MGNGTVETVPDLRLSTGPSDGSQIQPSPYLARSRCASCWGYIGYICNEEYGQTLLGRYSDGYEGLPS